MTRAVACGDTLTGLSAAYTVQLEEVAGDYDCRLAVALSAAYTVQLEEVAGDYDF